MKKHLLIISLILAVTAQTVFAAEVFNSPADLENFHERFYEAPTNTVPDMQVVEGSTMGDVRGMPLFKKTRIFLFSYLRIKSVLYGFVFVILTYKEHSINS